MENTVFYWGWVFTASLPSHGHCADHIEHTSCNTFSVVAWVYCGRCPALGLHVTISNTVRTSNLVDQNYKSVSVFIQSAQGRGNDSEKATFSNKRVWPAGREDLWRLSNGAAFSRPLSAGCIHFRFSCVLFLGLAWQQLAPCINLRPLFITLTVWTTSFYAENIKYFFV
jgi:hypothetical protein